MRRSKTNTKKLQKQSREEKRDTYFGKKQKFENKKFTEGILKYSLKL